MFNPDSIAILLGSLGNQSALRIIDLLTKPESGDGLKTENMLNLEIPKSTLYRVLAGLVDQGLVEIRDKKYFATEMAFHLIELLGEINRYSMTYRKKLIRDMLKKGGLLGNKAIEAAAEKALEVESEIGEFEKPVSEHGKITRDLLFQDVLNGVSVLVKQIQESKYVIDLIVSVSSGGAHIGGLLSRVLNLPFYQVARSNPGAEPDEPEKSTLLPGSLPDLSNKNILLVDDICKTGYSLNLVESECTTAAEVRKAALLLWIQAGEEEVPEEKRLDYRAFTSNNIALKMPWDKISK
jgi:hypoxanthine phosphoribosyltransferase